ncbi:hypothetical protein HDU76_011475 [Blyttiomyces sp. JEL0837]|nr:hypothetical protein HDU76_011475 [Blyttiomyces sp. JEL0837]
MATKCTNSYIKQKFQEAEEKKSWPVVILYPENDKNLYNSPSTIFLEPLFLWTIEINFPGGKPPCIICNKPGCPVTKESIVSRKVHDAEHCTIFACREWRCGTIKGKSKTFNTMNPQFVKLWPRMCFLRFPYVLGHNQGYSKYLIQQVIDSSIMSGKGVHRAIKDIEASRASRFAKLLKMFATIHRDKIERNQQSLDPTTVAVEGPTAMEPSEYFRYHKAPDRKVCRNLWMEFAEKLEEAAKSFLQSVRVLSSVHLDASYKFSAKLKVRAPDGQKVSVEQTKVIVTACNEIGQPLGFKFSGGESHDVVGALLADIVKHNIPPQSNTPIQTYTHEGIGSTSAHPTSHGDQFEMDDDQNDGDDVISRDMFCTYIAASELDNPDQLQISNPETTISINCIRTDDSNNATPNCNTSDIQSGSITPINRTSWKDPPTNETFPAINNEAEILIVADKANDIRALVERLGNRFRCAQDVIHFMWRPKVSLEVNYYKSFLKEYRNSFFYDKLELRSREQMYEYVRNLLMSIPEDVKKDKDRFDGTAANTLDQIRKGDLVPTKGTNVYRENGLIRKKVHTSNQEGIHSIVSGIMPIAIMDIALGTRILYIQFMKIAITQGEKFGRMPPLFRMNIADLLETTIYLRGVCSDNVYTDFAMSIFDNPQLDHSNNEVAQGPSSNNESVANASTSVSVLRQPSTLTPLLTPSSSTTSRNQQLLANWGKVLNIPISHTRIQNAVAVRPSRMAEVARQVQRVASGGPVKVLDSKEALLNQLQLTRREIQDQVPLTSDELALIKCIRQQQFREGQMDSTCLFQNCSLATTIIYNEAVTKSRENPDQLNCSLQHRSLICIDQALDKFSSEWSFTFDPAIQYRHTYIVELIERKRISNSNITLYETSFAYDLVQLLRSYGDYFNDKTRKAKFKSIWELGSRCCDRISRRSVKFLNTRYDTAGKQLKRNEEKLAKELFKTGENPSGGEDSQVGSDIEPEVETEFESEYDVQSNNNNQQERSVVITQAKTSSSIVRPANVNSTAGQAPTLTDLAAQMSQILNTFQALSSIHSIHPVPTIPTPAIPSNAATAITDLWSSRHVQSFVDFAGTMAIQDRKKWEKVKDYAVLFDSRYSTFKATDFKSKCT